MLYDLAIIGGGPAGISAAIYAARKNLRTVFITDKLAGQSVDSENIQNWIGIISISGAELAKKMEDHLRAYAKDIIDIKTKEKATFLKKNEGFFEIQTTKDNYQAKTVLITTGSHHKKLTIPGAKEFENKGVTYCATCDGPLFAGKDVAVVGGGNSGFDTSAQLLEYAKSVTLLQRGNKFLADPITVEKISAHPKMKAVLNAEITEIRGNDFVSSIIYKNTETGEMIELPVEGIFVEIGMTPATEFSADLVDLDKYGHIVIDHKTQRSSLEGIWAAGDCSNILYRQNNISVGDGIKAVEDIYLYLRTK